MLSLCLLERDGASAVAYSSAYSISSRAVSAHDEETIELLLRIGRIDEAIMALDELFKRGRPSAHLISSFFAEVATKHPQVRAQNEIRRIDHVVILTRSFLHVAALSADA